MLEQTPVLILAGGLGTRLRSSLGGRPKGLAPVAGCSFLEIQITLLARLGCRSFVLCVGHLAEQIIAELGDGTRLGVRIEYSREEEGRLLGTGGAIKLAERFFAPRAIVVNGDTYFDIDYQDLLAKHVEANRSASATATVALARVRDASRFGTVALDSSEHWVAAFREKDTSSASIGGLVNGGAYVIEREFLGRIPNDTKTSLEKEVFPRAVADGERLSAACFDQSFHDIGTPPSLKEFADTYGRTVSHHNTG